jgi:AcrR family transcriptional regulator
MARTRSTEAHDKVLHAALVLFGERGIDATSMDAISQASGVSKATIYNHWTDKEALLLEMMLWANGLTGEPKDVDTGDICRDIATILTRRPPGRFEKARERIMPSLVAYSATHAEFGMQWRHSVMEPPRECLRRVLRRGVQRGQLVPSLDVEIALALLLGPMLYSHVFLREKRPAPPELGVLVAKAFWRAFSMPIFARPGAKLVGARPKPARQSRRP